jgi:hypothetical protein
MNGLGIQFKSSFIANERRTKDRYEAALPLSIKCISGDKENSCGRRTKLSLRTNHRPSFAGALAAAQPMPESAPHWAFFPLRKTQSQQITPPLKLPQEHSDA